MRLYDPWCLLVTCLGSDCSSIVCALLCVCDSPRATASFFDLSPLAKLFRNVYVYTYAGFSIYEIRGFETTMGRVVPPARVVNGVIGLSN